MDNVVPHATTDDIVRLRTRFGTQLQVKCFKAELCARWMAQCESLQQLYQDICRLVTLTHPSAEPSLINHVGKEALITALSDGNFQLEVMMHEPLNVEAAFSYALKVKAYEQLLACQSTLVTDQDQGRAKHRSCHVYVCQVNGI